MSLTSKARSQIPAKNILPETNPVPHHTPQARPNNKAAMGSILPAACP